MVIQLSRGPVATVHIGGGTGITTPTPVTAPVRVSTPVAVSTPAITQMPVETMNASQIKSTTGLTLAPAVFSAINNTVKQLTSTVNVSANSMKNNINTLKPLTVAASLLKEVNKPVQVITSNALKASAAAAESAIKSIPLLNQRSFDSLVPVGNVVTAVNDVLARQTVQPVQSDLNKLKSNLDGYIIALDNHNSNLLSQQKSLSARLTSIDTSTSNNINNIINKSVADISNKYQASLKAIVPDVMAVSSKTSSVLSQLNKNNVSTHSDLVAIAADGVNSVSSLLRDQIKTSKTPEATSNLLAMAKLAFDNISDKYTSAQNINNANIKAATGSVLKYAGDAHAQAQDNVSFASGLVDAYVSNMKTTADKYKLTVSDTLKNAAITSNDVFTLSADLASKALEPRTVVLKSTSEIVYPTATPEPLQLTGKTFIEGGGAATPGSVGSAIKVPGAQPTGKASGSSDNTHYIWKDPKQPGVAFTQDEAKNNTNIQARINKGELVKAPDPNYTPSSSSANEGSSGSSASTPGTAQRPIKSMMGGVTDSKLLPSTAKDSSVHSMTSTKTPALTPIITGKVDYSGIKTTSNWNKYQIGTLSDGSPVYEYNADDVAGRAKTSVNRGTYADGSGFYTVHLGDKDVVTLKSTRLLTPEEAVKEAEAASGWEYKNNSYQKTIQSNPSDDVNALYSTRYGYTPATPPVITGWEGLAGAKAGAASALGAVIGQHLGNEEDLKLRSGVYTATDKALPFHPESNTAFKAEQIVSGLLRGRTFDQALSGTDVALTSDGRRLVNNVVLQLGVAGAKTDSVKGYLSMPSNDVIVTALSEATPEQLDHIVQNNPHLVSTMALNNQYGPVLVSRLGAQKVADIVAKSPPTSSEKAIAMSDNGVQTVRPFYVSDATGLPVVDAVLAPIWVGVGIEEGVARMSLSQGSKLLKGAEGVFAIAKESDAAKIAKAKEGTIAKILSKDEVVVKQSVDTSNAIKTVSSTPSSPIQNTIHVADNDYLIQPKANGPGYIATQYKDGKLLSSRETPSLAAKDILNAFSDDTAKVATPAEARPIKSMMPAESVTTPKTISLNEAFANLAVPDLKIGKSSVKASPEVVKAAEQAKASEEVLRASDIKNYDTRASFGVPEEAARLDSTGSMTSKSAALTDTSSIKAGEQLYSLDDGSAVFAGKNTPIGTTDKGLPYFEVTPAGNKVIGYQQQMDGSWRGVDENLYTVGGKIIDSEGKIATYDNPLDQGANPYDWAFGEGGVADDSSGIGSPGGNFGGGDAGGYSGGGDAGSPYTGAGASDTGSTPMVHFDPESNNNYVEVNGEKIYQDPGTGLYNVPEAEQKKINEATAKAKKDAEDAAKKAQDEADAKAKAEAEKAKQAAIRHWDDELKVEYVEDPDTKERIYYNPDTGSPTTKADLQAYLKAKTDKATADAAAAAAAKAQTDAEAKAAYERQLELNTAARDVYSEPYVAPTVSAEKSPAGYGYITPGAVAPSQAEISDFTKIMQEQQALDEAEKLYQRTFVSDVQAAAHDPTLGKLPVRSADGKSGMSKMGTAPFQDFLTKNGRELAYKDPEALSAIAKDLSDQKRTMLYDAYSEAVTKYNPGVLDADKAGFIYTPIEEGTLFDDFKKWMADHDLYDNQGIEDLRKWYAEGKPKGTKPNLYDYYQNFAKEYNSKLLNEIVGDDELIKSATTEGKILSPLEEKEIMRSQGMWPKSLSEETGVINTYQDTGYYKLLTDTQKAFIDRLVQGKLTVSEDADAGKLLQRGPEHFRNLVVDAQNAAYSKVPKLELPTTEVTTEVPQSEAITYNLKETTAEPTTSEVITSNIDDEILPDPGGLTPIERATGERKEQKGPIFQQATAEETSSGFDMLNLGEAPGGGTPPGRTPNIPDPSKGRNALWNRLQPFIDAHGSYRSGKLSAQGYGDMIATLSKEIAEDQIIREVAVPSEWANTLNNPDVVAYLSTIPGSKYGKTADLIKDWFRGYPKAGSLLDSAYAGARSKCLLGLADDPAVKAALTAGDLRDIENFRHLQNPNIADLKELDTKIGIANEIGGKADTIRTLNTDQYIQFREALKEDFGDAGDIAVKQADRIYTEARLRDFPVGLDDKVVAAARDSGVFRDASDLKHFDYLKKKMDSPDFFANDFEVRNLRRYLDSSNEAEKAALRHEYGLPDGITDVEVQQRLDQTVKINSDIAKDYFLHPDQAYTESFAEHGGLRQGLHDRYGEDVAQAYDTAFVRQKKAEIGADTHNLSPDDLKELDGIGDTPGSGGMAKLEDLYNTARAPPMADIQREMERLDGIITNPNTPLNQVREAEAQRKVLSEQYTHNFMNSLDKNEFWSTVVSKKPEDYSTYRAQALQWFGTDALKKMDRKYTAEFVDKILSIPNAGRLSDDEKWFLKEKIAGKDIIIKDHIEGLSNIYSKVDASTKEYMKQRLAGMLIPNKSWFGYGTTKGRITGVLKIWTWAQGIGFFGFLLEEAFQTGLLFGAPSVMYGWSDEDTVKWWQEKGLPFSDALLGAWKPFADAYNWTSTNIPYGKFLLWGWGGADFFIQSSIPMFRDTKLQGFEGKGYTYQDANGHYAFRTTQEVIDYWKSHPTAFFSNDEKTVNKYLDLRNGIPGPNSIFGSGEQGLAWLYYYGYKASAIPNVYQWETSKPEIFSKFKSWDENPSQRPPMPSQMPPTSGGSVPETISLSEPSSNLLFRGMTNLASPMAGGAQPNSATLSANSGQVPSQGVQATASSQVVGATGNRSVEYYSGLKQTPAFGTQDSKDFVDGITVHGGKYDGKIDLGFAFNKGFSLQQICSSAGKEACSAAIAPYIEINKGRLTERDIALLDAQDHYITQKALEGVYTENGQFNTSTFMNDMGVGKAGGMTVGQAINYVGEQNVKAGLTPYIETLVKNGDKGVIGNLHNISGLRAPVNDSLIEINSKNGVLDIKALSTSTGWDLNTIYTEFGRDHASELEAGTTALLEDPKNRTREVNDAIFSNTTTRYIATSYYATKDENELLGLYASGALSENDWGQVASSFQDRTGVNLKQMGELGPYDPSKAKNADGSLNAAYIAPYAAYGHSQAIADLEQEAKTDPISFAKTVDQANGLAIPDRYGKKDITSRLSAGAADVYNKYVLDPTNFASKKVDTVGLSVTWTDGKGDSHYQKIFPGDGTVLGKDGKYTDIAQIYNKDDTYEYTYKLNEHAYAQWLAGEGSYAGMSWDQFSKQPGVYVLSYKAKLPTDYSSSSSSKSSGGSSGSSSSKTYTPGQSGIFVSAGGLNADVSVNGQKIGTTDSAIIPIDAGSYIIMIMKAGYTPKTQAVTVYDGRTANITVTLYKVSPDICTFIEDIGGPDSITRDHMVYIYCLYKGYTYLAGIIKSKINLPASMPTKIYYSEVKYLFDLFSGDTAEAAALVAAQTVCKYTKGGVA